MKVVTWLYFCDDSLAGQPKLRDPACRVERQGTTVFTPSSCHPHAVFLTPCKSFLRSSFCKIWPEYRSTLTDIYPGLAYISAWWSFLNVTITPDVTCWGIQMLVVGLVGILLAWHIWWMVGKRILQFGEIQSMRDRPLFRKRVEQSSQVFVKVRMDIREWLWSIYHWLAEVKFAIVFVSPVHRMLVSVWSSGLFRLSIRSGVPEISAWSANEKKALIFNHPIICKRHTWAPQKQQWPPIRKAHATTLLTDSGTMS